MWNYVSDHWELGTAQFEADLTDPEHRTGPWSGHRRFAYDLVRNGRPEVVVELGTHYGVSFFAFCQAVKDGQIAARLHAVDTWKGEEHSGLYGEEVIELVRRVIQSHYADLDIGLHRCLFDDALREFDDESIDLLHIDGFHSYEAVQHDFTTWLPKLAAGGVVLFHDVDPASGYGSADYWRELAGKFPSLMFSHSFGLGVLFPKGADVHAPLLRERADVLIAAYGHRAQRELLALQVTTLTEMVEARDSAIESQTAMIIERDDLISAQNAIISSLRTTIENNEAAIDARDEAIEAQTRMIDERDWVLRSQAQLNEAREADLARLAEELKARDEHEVMIGRLERQIVARVPDALTSPPQAGDAPATPPAPKVVLRQIAARELRRQQAMARAIAPYLPAGVVRAGVKAKRAITRTSLWSRARGRPAPANPSLVPQSFWTVFDAEFYTSSYGTPSDLSPARHYLLHGWFRGLDPSPFFSVAWYLENCPEARESGTEPLTHYLESGYRSGHNPQPWFDGAWYAAENPDLDLSQMSPLEHYIVAGIAAGKSVSQTHFRLFSGSRSRARAQSPAELTAKVISGDSDEVTVPFATLPTTGYDVVTIDLWDTLLRRDRPADAAKVATARRMLLRLGPRATVGVWELFQRRVATELDISSNAADEEYELSNVLEQILAGLGLDRTEASTLAVELADAEVDDEISATHAVPELVAFVQQLREQPEPPAIAVLSDFYMGATRLERLLEAHGLDLTVLSSCELGGSKRLSTSFVTARARLGHPQGKHLHIGDDPLSDGQNAARSGATAVVVPRPDDPGLPRPGSLDETFYDRLLEGLGHDLSELGIALAPNELDHPLERESFLAGVVSATLPTALVAGAIETAAEQEASKIFYLSREGSFLAKLHREIVGSLAEKPSPKAVHLEVSRRSTFGASIGDVHEDCSARLWRQYPSQSVRGFLVSLGLDPAVFEPTAVRMGLTVDHVIDGIAHDLRFREFLEEPAVMTAIQEALTGQRARLTAYLENRGFADEGSPIVVDVGWRGTIQDNLCYLRPNSIISGVYLGLFPYLHRQPVNARKRAVIFDGNHSEDFGFVSPPAALESPWTPCVPTTLGYSWRQDGVAVAVGEIESDRADNLVAAYQRGVMAAAELVARRFVANGAVTPLLRGALQRHLRSYFEQPLPGVADIWFYSVHDDTFGALNVTPFGKLRPPLRLAYAPGEVRETDEAKASLWAAGYAQWRPVRSLSAIRTLRAG